jgi:transcriptional regulator of acetoin/glycerol metabolism
VVAQCKARLRAIPEGVVTQLIERQWIELEAAAEGVSVSAAEVDAAIAQEQKALGGAAAYERYLARTGQTPAQAAAQIRLGMIEQQLQARHAGAEPAVSNSQVAAFFAAHHAEFVLPGRPAPKLATYASRIRLLLAEQVRAQRSAAPRPVSSGTGASRRSAARATWSICVRTGRNGTGPRRPSRAPLILVCDPARRGIT